MTGSVVAEPTSLASRRAEHALDLEEAVDDLVSQLRSVSEVRKVIPFGSFASGRRDLFTDLDLIVVMDSSLDFVAATQTWQAVYAVAWRWTCWSTHGFISGAGPANCERARACAGAGCGDVEMASARRSR